MRMSPAISTTQPDASHALPDNQSGKWSSCAGANGAQRKPVTPEWCSPDNPTQSRDSPAAGRLSPAGSFRHSASAACMRTLSSCMDSPSGIRPSSVPFTSVRRQPLLRFRQRIDMALLQHAHIQLAQARLQHNVAAAGICDDARVCCVRPKSLVITAVMPSVLARSATCHACCTPFSVRGLSDWP